MEPRTCCELIIPSAQDAWFWREVKLQPSTVRYNPAQETSLDRLIPELESSAAPLAERRKAHRFYIRSEGKFVGVIALRTIDWNNKAAEVGYLIAESRQGRGIATQALRLLVQLTRKSRTTL